MSVVVPLPTHAQTTGALDVVATVVEYDGFLVSGAAAFSPSIRYDRGGFTFGAQGTWVTFESGNGIVQGDVGAGWLSPGTRGWRLETSGTFGVAKYSQSDGSGHTLARARIHYQKDGTGGWAGLSTGLTAAGSGFVPFEAGAGVWRVHNRWALVGSATGSWLAGARYVDVVGAARWTGEIITLDLRVGARPVSTFPSSDGVDRQAYAEGSARIRLTSHLEAMIAAGRSPGDPVRNALSSTYLSAGVRVNFLPERQPTLPIVAQALERAARSIRESPDGSQALLEVSGDGALRLAVEGATTVEIMADFTDWTATPLIHVDNGVWELPGSLAPGAYRLNIRIDGGPWAVPLGTRLEADEFGGAAGVIVVR